MASGGGAPGPTTALPCRPSRRVLQPQPEYAKYPVYTGMLGEVPIHMRLGAKPGEIDSVHGEYVAGKGQACGWSPASMKTAAS